MAPATCPTVDAIGSVPDNTCVAPRHLQSHYLRHVFAVQRSSDSSEVKMLAVSALQFKAARLTTPATTLPCFKWCER